MDIFENIPAGLDRIKISNAIKFMKIDTDAIKIASSNASSLVFIPRYDKNVYQYFSSEIISLRICEMMNILSENPTVLCELKMSKGFGKKSEKLLDETLEYNIFDYISRFEYCVVDDNIVVWEKILPMNSIQTDILPHFIEKNILKLLWDIGKALYGLHSKGYVHNDCRIDNIGINNIGNFVLFDFDGTVQEGERNISKLVDYKTLKESIEFVTGENMCENMCKVGEAGTIMKSMIISLSETMKLTRLEVFNMLENLQISHID